MNWVVPKAAVVGWMLSVVLSSCSSAPVALPVDTSRFETKIELKSKARVVVKAASKECAALQSTAKFEVVPVKGAAHPMKCVCNGNALVGQSEMLAVGQYQVRLSLRRHSLKELKPQITLELANPDYKSGPDQYAEAAAPVEPGKGVEGSVNYIEGDATDWLRVTGEKKRVYLTLVPAEDSKITAAVYRSPAGGGPTKLQTLALGKPAAFYLGKDDLLVKVVGTNQEAMVSYTVLRRDEDAKKAVALQVVDAYPVGASSSLVLLRPSSLVKADDELRISAKTESGQWKELGACRVTQTNADGVQCELTGAWSERFTEYRATGTAPAAGSAVWFRAPDARRSRTMAVFHRAVVASNHDPKKMGRIQVRYPHIEKKEEKPSEWAVVCLPYASKNSGMWFVPEEGDEVLVYLEGDDLEHPTVLGSLFNDTNAPPQSEHGSSGNADGKNDLKFLRTRSGHALSFNDTDSKQEVVLQDAGGSKLVLNASDQRLELTDSHGNTVRMEGEKITIQNSKGSMVTLEGEKIQIESKAISIAADKVSIEKASSIELGSGASEALVKGQSFMQLFNMHTHVCSGSGGSSSPPTSPMTPAMLSQKVKTS